jgi:hypothetical protein
MVINGRQIQHKKSEAHVMGLTVYFVAFNLLEVTASKDGLAAFE